MEPLTHNHRVGARRLHLLASQRHSAAQGEKPPVSSHRFKPGRWGALGVVTGGQRDVPGTVQEETTIGSGCGALNPSCLGSEGR